MPRISPPPLLWLPRACRAVASLGLVAFALHASFSHQIASAEDFQDTHAKHDVVSRIGVASVTPALLPAAARKLPIGFFKDYTWLSSAGRDRQRPLQYLPVLQYKGKADTARMRALVGLLWHAGQIPKLPGIGLSDLTDGMSLKRIQERLSNEHIVDTFSKGTTFVLGNEPGYQPNQDDRSPAEIVRDAREVKAMLDQLDFGYKLALGGISTPDNQFTRAAYGGMLGTTFLREILEQADDFKFDAFVIHPYPSDPRALSSADAKAQVLGFRRILKEFHLQDRSLIVGEVGVPFTAARANPEAIRQFTAEFVEFCLTYRDAELGKPTDEHRVVQKLVWFLLSPPAEPIAGFSDNPALDLELSALLNSEGELTTLGETFSHTVSWIQEQRQ